MGGIESQGIICSPAELDISDRHEGNDTSLGLCYREGFEGICGHR